MGAPTWAGFPRRTSAGSLSRAIRGQTLTGVSGKYEDTTWVGPLQGPRLSPRTIRTPSSGGRGGLQPGRRSRKKGRGRRDPMNRPGLKPGARSAGVRPGPGVKHFLSLRDPGCKQPRPPREAKSPSCDEAAPNVEGLAGRTIYCFSIGGTVGSVFALMMKARLMRMS